MPASVDRCVRKLIAKGYAKDRAWAICNSSYQKKRARKAKVTSTKRKG